jgi:hypothetical protein
VDGRETAGPWFTAGETVATRLTVPLKLFVPFTVIVKVVELPFCIDWDDGLAVIVKSGARLTVTEIATACEIDPLVPVTVTV